jgi:hypothetical protein
MTKEASIEEERDLYRKHFNEAIAEAKRKDEEFEKLQRLYMQLIKKQRTIKWKHDAESFKEAVGVSDEEFEAAVKSYNKLIESIPEGTHSQRVQLLVENYDPLIAVMLVERLEEQKLMMTQMKIAERATKMIIAALLG